MEQQSKSKSKFSCPACGSADVSRANKDTGRIGYLLLLIGLLLMVVYRVHYYSLVGIALILAAAFLVCGEIIHRIHFYHSYRRVGL